MINVVGDANEERRRPVGSGRRSRRGKSAPPRWTHDAAAANQWTREPV